MLNRTLKAITVLGALFSGAFLTSAQDLPNSKDPAGMKRYEGSELIGYRAPLFDEYLLPLGPPSSFSPPAYEKSKPVEGQVSYYTYLAPAGRSPAELFRNYKQEFSASASRFSMRKMPGNPETLAAPSTRLITTAISHKSLLMT